MSSAEQSALWQQLRDEATYTRQAYENEEQRKTTLYATALANEGIAAKGGKKATYDDLMTMVDGIFPAATNT
jgi:hypothetical protein